LATLSTPGDDVATGPATGSRGVPPFTPLDGVAAVAGSSPTPAQREALARVLPQLVKRRRSP
jgi:hypothetical protein